MMIFTAAHRQRRWQPATGCWQLARIDNRALPLLFLLLARGQSPAARRPVRSYRLQVRVRQHEPLRRTLPFEIHLDASVAALAFDVQNNAFAEFAVAHALAQTN